MKLLSSVISLAILVAFGALTGCETTDNGAPPVNSYYGAGFNDPWYYGGYYDDSDVIVVPPGGRHDIGAHPEQPIARPPASEARPMLQPSIPSMPRASSRR